MSTVNINLDHLARLSKLELNDAEKARFASQMLETVDYVRNMSDLDTQNVKPTSSVTDTHNITREDRLDQKRTLRPAVYKVPRILS